MKTFLSLLVCASGLLLVGCGDQTSDARVNELNARLAKVESANAELSNTLARVVNSRVVSVPDWARRDSSTDGVQSNTLALASIQQTVNSLVQTVYSGQSAPITPESKTYQVVNTDLGKLLIETDHVEPYLDGFKVHLSVGNPNAITFTGFNLVWSTYDTTNFFDTWHSATNPMTGRLISQHWNSVEFVIAPASADELRNASVRLDLSTVELLKPLDEDVH